MEFRKRAIIVPPQGARALRGAAAWQDPPLRAETYSVNIPDLSRQNNMPNSVSKQTREVANASLHPAKPRGRRNPNR